MADTDGAILTIDLGAVAANWRALAARTAPAVTGAVVKADGYGLGGVTIARALYAAGCTRFFVATIAEGVALRAALHSPEIVVFSGAIPGTEAEFAALGLIPALNSMAQIAAWSNEAKRRGERLPAALMLDSGMARLGLEATEAERLAAAPELLDGLEMVLVMSHLACADIPAHPLNADQLTRFRKLRRLFPKAPASLAASSGIFLGPEYHFDLVRPGAALFGLNPAPGQPNPMRQVVGLQARIVQVRNVDEGEAVGYGAEWRASRPARIAVVAAGYADGLPRALGNRGEGCLGEHRVPVVGRVSMDLMEFDVTGLPASVAHSGAIIELLGPTLTVDQMAERADTIGYEILTRLGHRYRRVYVGAATE